MAATTFPREGGDNPLARVIGYGTGGYPEGVRRRLQVTNAMAITIMVTAIVFGTVYGLLDLERYAPIVWINLFHVALAASVPFLHRFGELVGPLVLTLALNVTVFLLSWQLGRASGVQLSYLVAAAAPFAVFGLGRLPLTLGVVALGQGLHILAWLLFPVERAPIREYGFLLENTYVASSTAAFVVTALLTYYAFRLTARAEARSEALLLNILPAGVADRLKASPGQPIAERHPEATVLFADLVGFTPLTARLGPEQIVELLNTVFTTFDRLAARLRVEKVKTIGDSYMVVAGLPGPRPDHALVLAQMALAMLDQREELVGATGHSVDLRIGIDTGPVMAGVIGTTKFAYDVWGDTVNRAARLEATGEAGKIHASEAVRVALAGRFRFERRGAVELKGLGREHTWYLIGEDASGAGV